MNERRIVVSAARAEFDSPREAIEASRDRAERCAAETRYARGGVLVGLSYALDRLTLEFGAGLALDLVAAYDRVDWRDPAGRNPAQIDCDRCCTLEWAGSGRVERWDREEAFRPAIGRRLAMVSASRESAFCFFEGLADVIGVHVLVDRTTEERLLHWSVAYTLPEVGA